MFKGIRRLGIWGTENALALLLGVLVLGLGAALLKAGPARADEAIDKLKKVALSDVSLSQRLMALEALKVKGSTAATQALLPSVRK